MKEHNWLIEEVKDAKSDPKFYWICRKCGASGGPSFLPWEQLEVKKPKWLPFLAGTPLQPVSDDCDEAKKQIDDFIEKNPMWKEYVDKARKLITRTLSPAKRTPKDIIAEMSGLKHGRNQSGEYGPCEPNCRKCELEEELKQV